MNEFKIKRYRLLVFHLVFSTAFLGALTIYIANLPFLLLAPFNFRIWKFSGHITHMGLTCLRFFQPWWRGEIKVELPESVRNHRSGCLCVSNHRSHIDVFLLLEQIPCVRVLTKHQIFMIPGLGGAAYLLRMIFIKRGASASFWKAMDKVEQALRDRDIVHIFPEMTRAPFAQTELARFSLAPFQKAMAVDVPVVPIVIWGTDYLWPKGVYRIATRGPVVVKSLEPVDTKNFATASALSKHVREVIQKEVLELEKSHPYGASS